MYGKVVTVRHQAVTRKKDNRFAVALDSEQNNIHVKDIVKVIDGPHSVREWFGEGGPGAAGAPPLGLSLLQGPSLGRAGCLLVPWGCPLALRGHQIPPRILASPQGIPPSTPPGPPR